MHSINFFMADSQLISKKVNLKLSNTATQVMQTKMGAPHSNVLMNRWARLERLAASESRALIIVPKARIKLIGSKNLDGGFYA